MKPVADLIITLTTGLASWLAPLEVEPALKVVAAVGTTLGAGIMTAVYGLTSKDWIAKRLLAGPWRLIGVVALCTLCVGAYVAVQRTTSTESEVRYWSLACLLWVISFILAALFSLIGMLAAEKRRKAP